MRRMLSVLMIVLSVLAMPVSATDEWHRYFTYVGMMKIALPQLRAWNYEVAVLHAFAPLAVLAESCDYGELRNQDGLDCRSAFPRRIYVSTGRRSKNRLTNFSAGFLPLSSFGA